MDTLRHGEAAQAEFLAGHVREATLMGLAGAFVFSWTDDWYTGGHPIEDWAFGITHADRTPKAAYHALRRSSRRRLARSWRRRRASRWLSAPTTAARPSTSASVAAALDYPDYEVIVVDDGSTDDTPEILARFPEVRAIHQPTSGLSAARNVGLQAATGSILAYTDSDCFADAELADAPGPSTAAQRRGGGRRAEPDPGGRLARRLRGRRAGPADARAGERPGRRAHPRLQHGLPPRGPGGDQRLRSPVSQGRRRRGCLLAAAAGRAYWITFAPGAFVWHHRRQTPRAYLRQQAGYGEAEALLRFKHPDKFNGRGDGKWRGVLYGPRCRACSSPLPIIYRGTFGTGLFQCLYQPGPAHWAMLPSTLEWHLAAVLHGLAARPAVGWVSGPACSACRCWSPPCRRVRHASSPPTGAVRPTAHRRRSATPSRWSAPGRDTDPAGIAACSRA